MAQYDRTLGKTGSDLLTEMTRQGKRIFTFKDAAKTYGSSGQSLRELLSTLVKRGWLLRVEKGKYLILPLEAGREREWTEHEFIIASYLIEPYYIGFRSALNYYGYTEQISRTVFIVSTRRKLKSSLEVSGVTYRFVSLAERKFFGVRQVSINGYQVNISEPEKTIVDCLDQLRYCGGISEVAKALWYGRDELDLVKMAEYSRRNGNRAAGQRLGYLIEMLGLRAEKAIDLLLQSMSNRYAPLDTLSESKGRYIDRWKIVANVPDDELSRWKEQR
jgi:predicted transcriptional regulator of viral defense system